MKVLIADEHEIVREGLTRLIERQLNMSVIGYAENGLEAVVKSRTLNPDIVIMDSGMPVLSGINAVPLIRKSVPDAKIIIFSINKNDEYIHSSFQSGAHGYVLKLSPSRDIIDSIRTALKGERFISPLIKKSVIDMYAENPGGIFTECLYDLLSKIEQCVFRLIVEGFSTREIAVKLCTSQEKVLGLAMSISDKIQLHDRESMERYAEEIGIITRDNWKDPIFDALTADLSNAG